MWDVWILPKSVSGLAGEMFHLWWISCENKVNHTCSALYGGYWFRLGGACVSVRWWGFIPRCPWLLDEIDGNIMVDLVRI